MARDATADVTLDATGYIDVTVIHDRLVTPDRPEPSVLDEVRGIEDRVAARLRALAPLVAEFEELRAVAERLGLDVGDELPAPVPAPRARRRSDGATQAVGARRREEVAGLVARQPGLTVAQLAAELDVDRTALYRVIRRLEADGRVVKEGATIRPA